MTVYLLNPYQLGWRPYYNALFIGPMTLNWFRLPKGEICIQPFWGYNHPMGQTFICPLDWRR